jgi:hypothetical protein
MKLKRGALAFRPAVAGHRDPRENSVAISDAHPGLNPVAW